jgi:hypothetical protein
MGIATEILPAAEGLGNMGGAGRQVTAKEILVGARALVDQGWCQGVDARDAHGDRCAPWHREARAWSVLGALVASEGEEPDVRAHAAASIAELGHAVALLADAAETSSLQAWNDAPGRTVEEVLGAFDRALARLS